MYRSLVTLTPLLLAGCIVSVPGKESAEHHLVLGFGIVSVNEAPHEAAIATEVRALGISISDRPGLKMGIGYSSSSVVTVAEGAEDVRIAASRTPGCPFQVLKRYNLQGEEGVLSWIRTFRIKRLLPGGGNGRSCIPPWGYPFLGPYRRIPTW